jgi:hypothetical protein
MQNPEQLLRIHRDRFGLPGAAIDDRRNLTLTTEPAGIVPADRVATNRFEYCFHDRSSVPHTRGPCRGSHYPVAHPTQTNNFETDLYS